MIRARASTSSALLLALGLLPMGGCGSTSPPAQAAPKPVVAQERSFSFRDPRPSAAAARVLSSKQARLLDQALQAISRHDAAGAEASLVKAGAKEAKAPLPLRLASAYVALLSERWDAAREQLDAVLTTSPELVAALEARAELDLYEGELRDALSGFVRASRLLPQDADLKRRVSEVKKQIFVSRREEADEALQKGDVDGARRAALSLIELDPASPAGLRVLARVAEAQGRLEDAYSTAVKARAMAPQDREWNVVVASLAMKASRFAEAIQLYEELAATDRSLEPRVREAKLEFQIQNLPEVAQRAARSAKLTRGQLAVLMWWTVPEVQNAAAGSAAEVAVDVLDRPEKAALVRAIGLGFFSVSRDTHRVGVDVPVSRTELASLLGRLASIVASTSRSRRLPDCLHGEPTAAGLAGCGILSENGGRSVTGRDTMLALERAARAAREGRIG